MPYILAFLPMPHLQSTSLLTSPGSFRLSAHDRAKRANTSIEVEPNHNHHCSDGFDLTPHTNKMSFSYQNMGTTEEELDIIMQLINPILFPPPNTSADDSLQICSPDFLDCQQGLTGLGRNQELCDAAGGNPAWQHQDASMINYKETQLQQAIANPAQHPRPSRNLCGATKRKPVPLVHQQRHAAAQTPATSPDSEQDEPPAATRNRHSFTERNYRRRLNLKFNRLVAALGKTVAVRPPGYLTGPDINVETARKGQILDTATTQLLWLASETVRLNSEVGRLNGLLATR